MAPIKTRASRLFPFGILALLALIPSNAPAQKRAGAGTSPSAPPAASASAPAAEPRSGLANFAWLEGRWLGAWGPRVAEQCWTAPKAGMMLGTFRLVEDEKTLVLELFTLVEKPDGINFYFRHFTPALVPWEKADATVLNLVSLDGARFVFENPVNGEPKHSILTRLDADTYVARSEIVTETGDTQVIEITYHRQKNPAATPPIAASGASGGSGAHR
jgi:Domain of unknown function (DUF6265)